MESKTGFKIALISFEYPPEMLSGGIGTYIYQLSLLLFKRGHYVEVFSASPLRNGSGDEGNGFLVHRIKTRKRKLFRELVVPVFTERHRLIQFDLFETPEFMADGLLVKKHFPHLPMVIKLHTPFFMVRQINILNIRYWSLKKNIKPMLFALAVKMHQRLYTALQLYRNDIEYICTKKAELICSPSGALRKIISDTWRIRQERIIRIPNPYNPSPELLAIPSNRETGVVSYIGRLEIRKGAAIFAKVIPIVLSALPSVKFRFVGRNESSPVPGILMKEYLQQQLEKYMHSIEFTGEVPVTEVHNYLSATDVCVLPSIWENFPNTCLEAMSAACAIVASRNGGMQEMLTGPIAGILVDPFDHTEIANAIIGLLKDKELRWRLAEQARENVLKKYDEETIGTLIDACYKKII